MKFNILEPNQLVCKYCDTFCVKNKNIRVFVVLYIVYCIRSHISVNSLVPNMFISLLIDFTTSAYPDYITKKETSGVKKSRISSPLSPPVCLKLPFRISGHVNFTTWPILWPCHIYLFHRSCFKAHVRDKSTYVFANCLQNVAWSRLYFHSTISIQTYCQITYLPRSKNVHFIFFLYFSVLWSNPDIFKISIQDWLVHKRFTDVQKCREW